MEPAGVTLNTGIYNVVISQLNIFTLLLIGIPVEDKVNIFINSFGSIQETTMVSGLSHSNDYLSLYFSILVSIILLVLELFYGRKVP